MTAAEGNYGLVTAEVHDDGTVVVTVAGEEPVTYPTLEDAERVHQLGWIPRPEEDQ